MQHDPDQVVHKVIHTDEPHFNAITDEEIRLLLQCIDLALKQSKDSIDSAKALLPIVDKLTRHSSATKPGKI